MGIQVSWSSKGIFLSQRKYVLDLLHETRMSSCQPIGTPMENNMKLFIKTSRIPVCSERYQWLVERLMY